MLYLENFIISDQWVSRTVENSSTSFLSDSKKICRKLYQVTKLEQKHRNSRKWFFQLTNCLHQFPSQMRKKKK